VAMVFSVLVRVDDLYHVYMLRRQKSLASKLKGLESL